MCKSVSIRNFTNLMLMIEICILELSLFSYLKFLYISFDRYFQMRPTIQPFKWWCVTINADDHRWQSHIVNIFPSHSCCCAILQHISLRLDMVAVVFHTVASFHSFINLLCLWIIGIPSDAYYHKYLWMNTHTLTHARTHARIKKVFGIYG